MSEVKKTGIAASKNGDAAVAAVDEAKSKSASFSIPAVGLGTFQARGDAVVAAVTEALACGYRHIDTAAVYRNEEDIAKAIAATKVPRGAIFLCTKLAPKNMGSEAAAYAAATDCQRRLGTDYADLILVHWPALAKVRSEDGGRHARARRDAWRALERLHGEGRARAIGVSNYLPRHLDELMEYAKVKPAVNQFELHPLLTQSELMQSCARHGVRVVAYSSFGQGSRELLEHKTVVRIAQENKVLLRWGLQHGAAAVIPKSVTAERICENFAIAPGGKLESWRLSDAEMAELTGLNADKHFAWDPKLVR